MSDKLNYIYDSEIFIDLYEILELNIECTPDEIKSSYIRLAKKHHPDQGGNSDLFQEVTRAYEILYSEITRKEYDLYYLKKSTDQYKVDDAIKFKNEFINFINTNKKIISEEKLDELYNDVFKDRIEYKEVKLESVDLKKRINDINLERKNIDIDTLDDRLYNLVN
jgi:curved DNA-binding protein CbpA